MQVLILRMIMITVKMKITDSPPVYYLGHAEKLLGVQRDFVGV